MVCWLRVFSQPWLCTAQAPEVPLDPELSAPGRAGAWTEAAGSWQAARLCLLQGLPCSAQEGAPEAPVWLPRAGSSWEVFAAAPGLAGWGALPELASGVVKSWQQPADPSGRNLHRSGEPNVQNMGICRLWVLLPTPPTTGTAAPGLPRAPPAQPSPCPSLQGSAASHQPPARGRGWCFAPQCRPGLAGESCRRRAAGGGRGDCGARTLHNPGCIA